MYATTHCNSNNLARVVSSTSLYSLGFCSSCDSFIKWYFVSAYIQLCARAIVGMEAPVQLQTPAHVLQDGEDRGAEQVFCCWLDKPF